MLKVPASALFRRGQDWSVFVVEDSRARARTVEIGHRNALEAELVKGLGEGVEVILHPGINYPKVLVWVRERYVSEGILE